MAMVLLHMAGEDRDARTLPTMHSKAPLPPLPPSVRNHPVQNVNSTKVGNLHWKHCQYLYRLLWKRKAPS